ncbi:hypothetical protein DICPUDRAFT_51786 [Dictyostelium purpureum]|uniref:non-specific serine/threonine protein kinase n=1 Tax=Dictyostelium purpureum TaxID=5786 RepID=F1A5I0_DICPU|nr:uncharacterized protein DICPUDRAFT_51786 [Dictyostelium purpureum]EGC28547.1 hypothetical protein DICPUDRAFT_51786 [Dictyostelium purpureum]|eukprot:XP_003294924.1 hypothetical protein DICPUDRAFT_51786 [Dictyostelium purpureum]
MYKYEKIKLIGSGGEGKAHVVKKIDSGKQYVMKQRDFLLLDEASEGLNEAMQLAKISSNSPNIVKFEEVFINQNNSLFSLCIVMEYCEGGDLMNNMICRVSELFKSNNENNNSKTNSLSSSNGLNMSTLNVLKMYEDFFSRYLPNYISATENVITPHSLNDISNKNNSLLLMESNRSSMDFSSDDSCLQAQSFSSGTRSRTLSFSSKPISNSTPQLQHELLYNSPSPISKPGVNCVNLRTSSSFEISPIKSDSKITSPIQKNNIPSPCSSGPTSPQNKVIKSNDKQNISTESSSKNTPQSNTDKKKTWWKTFKKERSQSTFNLFEKAFTLKSKRTSTPPQQVNLQTLFNTQQSDNVCQIQSSNSSISLKIPRIPKRLLYSWIFQICLGVQSIHKAHLVHRDLKSENIFLTESQIIKIGDFGLATKYENHIRGVAGTYYYSSPEVIQNISYSRPADIFSLGCIFYEMCTLHLLPVTKRCIAEELIEKRFDRKVFKEDFDEEDEQLADLILEMLSVDPNIRPTIDSIVFNKVFDKLKDPCSVVGMSNGTNTAQNNNKRETPLQRNKSIMQDLLISNDVSSASEMNQQRQGITRRQLDKSELNRAGEILAESFSNDPRFLFVCGATSNKPDIVNKSTELGHALRKDFFNKCIRLMYQNKFMLWGCFNQENQLIGVACWQAPGKNSPSMVQIVIRVISLLPKFGFRVMRRIGKLMSGMESAMRNSETQVNEPANDIYYLPYVGVSRDYRSQGVGDYLLKPVIEWAEHQGKKVKTISFSEKQINFFNKTGFTVCHTEPVSNLKGINSIYVLSKNP